MFLIPVFANAEITKDQIKLDATMYSYVYGVDFALADKIISCESGYDIFAKNLHSTASGIFQFINATYSETMVRMGYSATTSKTAYPVSLEAGFWKIAHDGTSAWSECLKS